MVALPLPKEKRDNYTSKEDWIGTSVLGIALVAIDLIVLFIGSRIYNDPIWIIAATGIITFFGMLMISSYHKRSIASSDKGTMRDALTGSLISVYFIVLGFMFKGVQTSDPLLNNFSNVIVILVAFYFGSKAATEIYKKKKG